MNQVHHLNVLLVDDDPALLQSMCDLFQFFKFSVDAAGSGEEAWQKVQQGNYDVVVTDVRMRKMSGMELLRRIKQKDHSKTKVVIASAFSDHSEEDFFNAGADGFFEKPFQASTVRDFLWQASKTPKERWSVVPSAEQETQLKADFTSLAEARKNSEFSLGRIGFFIHHQKPAANVDDWVHFQLRFSQEPRLPLIEGMGKVRWKRLSSDENTRAGLGIEFKHLNDNCLDEVLRLIDEEDPIASIPRR